MDLTDKLKSTLENTYNLALKLEEVSSMIIPKKIGERGRKRLISINKEIKNFYNLTESKEKDSQTFRKPQSKQIITAKAKPYSLNNDYTSMKVKKNLSISIKEVNQRVKLSRAGKNSIAKLMSNRRPSLTLSDFQTFHSELTPKNITTESFEEKPQPYVCLTSGKIEDPITLPTFSEFLLSKGEEHTVRGKDELFYRIDKATEQISRLKENIQSKNFGKNTEDKQKMIRTSTKTQKNEPELKSGKKNDLKAIMNQYFNMPCFYESPKVVKKHLATTSTKAILSSDAEDALEDTLRSFNQTKDVENRKILDILDKLKIDRPKVLKQKIVLIQKDKEKYKNRHRSIEKFNSFRDQIEKNKREVQFKIYQQGLVYLEILDEFKRRRHKPSEPELIILSCWKKVIESGCLITKTELRDIVSIISPECIENKDVNVLLEKLSSSINV